MNTPRNIALSCIVLFIIGLLTSKFGIIVPIMFGAVVVLLAAFVVTCLDKGLLARNLGPGHWIVEQHLFGNGGTPCDVITVGSGDSTEAKRYWFGHWIGNPFTRRVRETNEIKVYRRQKVTENGKEVYKKDESGLPIVTVETISVGAIRLKIDMWVRESKLEILDGSTVDVVFLVIFKPIDPLKFMNINPGQGFVLTIATIQRFLIDTVSKLKDYDECVKDLDERVCALFRDKTEIDNTARMYGLEVVDIALQSWSSSTAKERQLISAQQAATALAVERQSTARAEKEVTLINADAEAERVSRVGNAEAEVDRKKINALGSQGPRVALARAIQEAQPSTLIVSGESDNNKGIVPAIHIGGQDPNRP